MRRDQNGCFLPIFLSLFAVVGVGLMVWGAIVLRNASLSSNWPAVQGEIVRSFVREDHDEDGTTYHAEISYTYVANDQRYTAVTVNFGQYGSSNTSHAQEIVSRYPLGKKVMVYYDPEKPETAVLEPGVTWSSYLILGMGFLFTFIPFISLVGNTIRRHRF